MKIKNIREFYTLVDLLVSALTEDDYLEVVFNFSGIITRGSGDNIDKIHVGDTKGKVSASYDINGLMMTNVINKSIVNWVSEAEEKKRYTWANSYLAFIDNVDYITIESITYNGESMHDALTAQDGSLSLAGLMKIVTEKLNCNIKLNLNKNGKILTLQYIDGVFVRFVKLANTYTLYVNNPSSIEEVFKDYMVDGFAICYGLPCVTTQIEYYKNMTKKDGCEFKLVSM